MATGTLGKVRRADTDPDFARFGIDRNTIAVWEDGRRESGAAGRFEWWYFEARLEVLGLPTLAIVIAFFVKPMDAAHGPEAPMMSIRAHALLSGPHGMELPPVPPAEFSADAAQCDVRIGPSRCRVEANGNYVVEFEAPDVRGSLVLVPSSPAARIGTGHLLFEDGAGGDQYLGWVVAVPSAVAHIDCVVGGMRYQGTGRGYHDHNWGDAPMPRAVHHWYWGRADVGPFSINFARVTPQAAFGSAEHADLVLFENRTILACGSVGVTVSTGPASPDPGSHKPFSRDITVDFRSPGLHCVAHFKSIKSGFRKRSPSGEAAYHRDAAICTLLVTRGGEPELFGPVFTTFEMMWFGEEASPAALAVFSQGLAEPVQLQELSMLQTYPPAGASL